MSAHPEWWEKSSDSLPLEKIEVRLKDIVSTNFLPYKT